MAEADRLSFHAEHVAVTDDVYGADRVYAVHFGCGDPERGGHHWNFQRCFSGDDGVCTVREIQQATLYEGIRRFDATRGQVRCVFEATAVADAGFREVAITFEIGDVEWNRLADGLDTVFRDRAYYSRDAT